MPTVRASSLGWVAAGYRALGMDLDGTARALGIPTDTFQRLDEVTDVPASFFLGLLRNALDGDPAFALRAAAAAPFGAHALLDYTNAACSTLDDVVSSLVRYFRVVSATLRFERHVEDPWCDLVLRTAAPVPPWVATAVQEYTLVYSARRMHEVVGQPAVRQILVPWSAPAYAARYQSASPSPVHFGAPCAALRLALRDLSLPSQRADARLHQLLAKTAEAALSRVAAAPTTVRDLVQAALLELLPQGLPSMPQVARRVGMSVRTLRRRLADEGTVFDAERERLLKALACQFLEERGRSVEEVAYLLGFSEARAFHRAFKRWTGVSAGQFRARSAAQ
ncbi:MAG: AraC family transcriptional regulator ligand-binding domain-containing protein [Myxococcota bacterium]